MKKPFVEYSAPLLLWLLVIFSFSTDVFASGETSRVIGAFLKFLFPSLSLHEIDFWHGVIRKAGHVSEYFVLALLAYRSLRPVLPDPAQARLRTMFLVVLAATFDELHQGLTLFRTASPLDVGYDCLGAVWALWLIATYESGRLRTYPVL